MDLNVALGYPFGVIFTNVSVGFLSGAIHEKDVGCGGIHGDPVTRICGVRTTGRAAGSAGSSDRRRGCRPEGDRDAILFDLP